MLNIFSDVFAAFLIEKKFFFSVTVLEKMQIYSHDKERAALCKLHQIYLQSVKNWLNFITVE